MRKNTIILACGIIVVSLLLLMVSKFGVKRGSSVVITINGEEYDSFSLYEDNRCELEGFSGGHNTLVISGGYAYIESADCPDKLCMQQGRINKVGEQIVCLPHRIVITIQGDRQKDEPQVDTIAK